MHNDPIDHRKIPQPVQQILSRLDQKGFETWLVGGCVRDLCLGLEPKDFDLATNARPEQVQQLFSHHYATGLQHGTITVIWSDLAVEITTFRSESAYTDSRRPDLVVFHDQVEEDLSRRDFTMNSMAWRPDRGLLDLHGGLNDLRSGILRSVGNPRDRFDEDALRLLRAVRFAVTYDLTPDPQIIAAAAQSADRLDRLSRERITAEIMRILDAPNPMKLLAFSGCGLLAKASEILLLRQTDDSQLCQRLSSLIRSGLLPEQRLPLLYLAVFAPDFSASGLFRTLMPCFPARGGHQLEQLLMHECRLSRHLALSGEAILYLMYLRLLLPLQLPPARLSQFRLMRLLARRCHLSSSAIDPVISSAEKLLQLFLPDNFSTPDTPAFAFCREGGIESLTLAELALNGSQLQSAGWAPGPRLRIILERLLSWAIQSPENNQPAVLMMFARTHWPPFSSKGSSK